MQSRFVLGLLVVALLGIYTGAQASSAQSQPNDTTVVVVAEDKTSETDCKRWIDSPTNEAACEPGSVIIARRTTYREVAQAGSAHYAFLTGNQQQDIGIERDLVAKVTAQIRGPQIQPSACTEAWPWVIGSYLSIPDNPNSTRIT